MPSRCFTLLSLLAVHVIALAAAQTPPGLDKIAITMAETPQIGELRLSPDGKWATYTVIRRSVEKNTRETVRYLQRIPRGDDAVEEAKLLKLPEIAVGVQWRPDSACLSMVLGGVAYDYGREQAASDTSFVCYDIATGEMEIIPTQGRAVTTNYEWSPSGRYVAFLAPLAERIPLDPRRGVPHGLIEPGEPMALFVLDVKTGAITQLTSEKTNVARSPHGNFAWSPDERELAVAIDRQMQSSGLDTDLVVIDRRNRRLRTLVTRPGMNGRPCWSPDGRSIAFATHQSDPAYRVGWPAIISAKGGNIVDFPQDAPMGFSTCHWSADNHAFYYESSIEMTRHLVRAETSSRRAGALPQASDLPLAFEDDRSFNADGSLMVFTRESLTTPPDLYVVELDLEGNPDGAPVRLTRIAPHFALGNNVHTEEINWLSKDGKFTVHGLLLTPVSVEGKLPTLLYITGGPSMVRRQFIPGGWGAYLPLVARGYAVLIPNTRGRGGYGVEFHDAIRTGKNRGRDPLADALAGLDLLIERKIADPEQMGVLGFSYGSYLTNYAITQTNRFKAAVSYDGSAFLAGTAGYPVKFGFRQGAIASLAVRDLFGVHNPFDSIEHARILEEAPGLHADRVHTPVLLLYATHGMVSPPYGAQASNGWIHGLPFYHALRRFNTPAAFFAYDEPHGFQRPAAIADNITRTSEWLDYWVRGHPFPDPVRAREYGREEWGESEGLQEAIGASN